MIFIGADPGLTGGLAVVEAGELLEAIDLPIVDKKTNVPLLAQFARDWPGAVVGIEVQQSMPGQGLSSTLKTGRGWGSIEGVFGGLGHRVIEIRSQKWKPAMNLRGKDKEASRALALSLWPELGAKVFARKRDEGRAEAALIALYASRIFNSGNQPTQEA